jgi:hypothetical protein
MSPLTIIYYTSNTENTSFEEKIRQILTEDAQETPIISVSQKPITLGYNICVGDVGRSSYNQWRQLQIGASAATTRFVALAESDFLYSKEHFNSPTPKEDVFYAPLRVYQLCTMANRVHKFIPLHKRYREGTSIVGRDYLLRTLDTMLEKETWRPGIEPPSKMLLHLFFNRNSSLYHNVTPIVTFRTDAGMHQHIHDDHPNGIDEIPYWGDVDSLIGRFL